MTCQDCGIEDETVTENICPFAKEIHGIEEDIIVCKNCYRERLWDI